MTPYVANLVGKSVESPCYYPHLPRRKLRRKRCEVEADVLLSHIFFGDHYSRLSRYFHSQGRHNTFGYTNPEVDALLFQLDETTDVTQRGVIGRKVISLLQEDYAIILLSPHFQYFLSPLEIQFDATLTSHSDLIENMKHLVVKRH